MDALTRLQVRQRAGDCCEYCRLPQSFGDYLPFHVEHIHAQQHVVDDSLENLAFACPDCNRHKGPNLTTFIEGTRDIIALFHPRKDRWIEHFEYRGAILFGLTPTGEATVRLLKINTVDRVEMRAELIASGDMLDV